MKNNANNMRLNTGAKVPDKGNQSIDSRATSPKRGLFKRYGASLIVGLIGLVLSLAMFFSVEEWQIESRKFDFDRLAEARCNSFRNEVTHLLHELTALKRFYDGSQFVSREEFTQFVTPVFGAHQDLRGFVWAPRVTDTDRKAFEQSLQAEGWANYLIHDSSALGETKIATHRKEYYPVLYRAPRIDWAIGLDQLTLLPRREAIEQTRDMNQVIVTRPTVFPGEPKDRLGIIAFAPVYKKGLPITTVEERRAAIEGVVICAMRAGDIIESVIEELQPGGVDIRISDVSSPEDVQLLYQHRSRLQNPGEGDSLSKGDNNSGLLFVTSFDVANRTWEMRCTPSSGYLESHPIWIHWILLLGGLILTSLLAVFIYIRQNRMAIIEELVHERTAQLRASEQQQRAANQQLMASEQQQRAANQQLMASEQQLRAANQQLMASEERYRAIAEDSPVLICRFLPDGEITYANEAYCKYFEKTSEELFGSTFLSMIPEADQETVMNKISTVTIELPTQSHEHPVIAPNGEIRWQRWTNRALFDAEGKVVIYQSIGEDITDRKQSEQALKESEERFRNVVESMSDWIWEVDAHGVYTYVSPNIESILGYTIKEILGKTPFDLMPQEEAKRVGLQFQAILRNKEPIRNLENWNLHKNGQRVCLMTNGVPLLDDQGNLLGYRGVDSDITETRRLQELESRAERLETAGQIAGQIAHDFNNLLAPLVAYPDFIREELPINHPALPYLSDMEKSAEQIADINQQLLTLSRRGYYNQEPLNLNDIVLHAIKENKPLPEMLSCETNLGEDIMNIIGGGSQIHRVISNLLHNARDAMKDIGQITIKTENYYVDDVSIAYGRVPKGEYVKLTISDTGCGVPGNIVQKIFDPFFTSKTTDRRRGSGLGLSVVDSVVKDHGGYVDLSTKVGEGTSFYIYFPVTRESTDRQYADKTIGGNETILVVDDDKVQLDVSTQILMKLGYKVATAESGEKAIEFLKENPRDLIILDMIMPPGIDGAETYRRVLEINPNQKAIIVSGFSETERVFEVQKLGAGAFIKKPLSRGAIAAAVRTELDR